MFAPFAAFAGKVRRLARRLRRGDDAVAGLAVHAGPARLARQVAAPERAAPPERAVADEHVLQSARVQWHLGDWEALAALPDTLLQAHPDRAELAILAASAAQQLDCHDAAVRYLRIARAAGCDKRQAARILIAGVHNSLGRAHALTGDQAGAERHFRMAVGSTLPGLDSPLVAQARARNETARLVSTLTPPAAAPDGRTGAPATLAQP